MSSQKFTRVLRIVFILIIFFLASASAIQDPTGLENSTGQIHSYVKSLLPNNASIISPDKSDTTNDQTAPILFNLSDRISQSKEIAVMSDSLPASNYSQYDFNGADNYMNIIEHMSLGEYAEIQWQKCLGGSAYDRGASIEQTNDGNYIVAGTTASDNGDMAGGGFHGGFDFWIAELDRSGSILWQKCLGGNGSDTAYSIRQTNDGGYIVAGDTNSNDSDMSENHGSYDFWIAKLDDSGAIQWQRCLGGSDYDTARSVQQTNDGGYVVAGWTYSNDSDVAGGGFHGNADYWVVKLSNRGAIQWQKCLGGSDNEGAENIITTDDGGFIVTGSTYSSDKDVTGKHNPGSPNPDFWVVKLNSAGIIQWQKCLGGSNADWSYGIQQTNDGGYVVGGKTWSSDGDVSENSGQFDAWVVKLNSAGIIQWQKSYGGSHTDEVYSIKQTDDGGYIITGDTYSDDGDVDGSHVAPLYIFPDFWVAKLDSTGSIDWQRALGGSLADIAHGIEETDEGKYLVIGVTSSNDGDVSGNHGLADVWVTEISTIPEPGPSIIALQAFNGQYVSADGGGGDGVLANSNTIGPWENLKLIDLGDGNVALQASNGQYLCAEGGGGDGVVANRDWIAGWETFKLIDRGNGYYALQAFNGQYVCAEGGGGDGVVANRNAIDAWETFRIMDLRRPAKVAIKAYNGQYVSAEGGGGDGVVANRDWVAGWETFNLIDRGNGNVALQAYNGQYLCAEGGGGGAVVANRNAINAWETFKLIYRGSGNVALQAYNGQYFCAEGGGGNGVVANRNWIAGWETFNLIPT